MSRLAFGVLIRFLFLVLVLFLLVERAPLDLYANSGWPFFVDVARSLIGRVALQRDRVRRPRRGCPIEEEEVEENGRNITTPLLFMLHY